MYAAWSDGTAATGFEYSLPRSIRFSHENAMNGISPEIGPIERIVQSSSPSRLASQGGAAGKSANVAKPMAASSATVPT